MDDFFHTLGSNLPLSEQRDRMIWKLSKKGDFDVRLFYDKLQCPLPIIFPWKGVWKVKAPTHVSFFVWSATWEKILTGDILRCKGFDFVDWCILCRSNGETANHLLLHCGKAFQLWSLVFRSFGISWVLPRSIADMLFDWWNWLGKHSSRVWNLASLCLMRCIWRERNWRTFEDRDKTDDQLLAYFSGSLFDWSRAWGLTSSDSIPMFLSSLLCNQFFVGFTCFLVFSFSSPFLCFLLCTLCYALCFHEVFLI